jgi:hypothetical protein
MDIGIASAKDLEILAFSHDKAARLTPITTGNLLQRWNREGI